MDEEKNKKNDDNKDNSFEDKYEQLTNEEKEMINMLGINKEDFDIIQDKENGTIKIIDIKRKNSLGKRILRVMIDVLLSFLILFSLTGYFKWISYDYLWQVSVLIVIFLVLDKIFSFIIFNKLFKLYILTFGIIETFSSLICYIVAIIVSFRFFSSMSLESTGYAIIVFIIYNIFKKLISFLIINNRPRIKKNK